MEYPCNGEVHAGLNNFIQFRNSMKLSYLGIDEIDMKTSHTCFFDPLRERTDGGRKIVVGRAPSWSGFEELWTCFEPSVTGALRIRLHVFWNIFSACRPLSHAAGTVRRRGMSSEA